MHHLRLTCPIHLIHDFYYFNNVSRIVHIVNPLIMWLGPSLCRLLLSSIIQRFTKNVSLVTLLTNSTSRIILVKLRDFQPKKFTAFYGTRSFLCRSQELFFFPILREINWVHALSLYLFNIYLKFIIPYTPFFPDGSFPLSFFTTAPYVFLSLPCLSH